MKPGSNGRRPRGRPNRKQHGGPARPNNFDSGGPEGRVRGNAHQVYERYLAMARDAVSAGDRIASETYYQHAEHYFRVLNASTDPQPNGQGRQDRHGSDTRQEGGQHDGGRRRDQRQDGPRAEASRPDGQPASDVRDNEQPQVSPMPVTNGQDAATALGSGPAPGPAVARSPNQGGRHRRSPARNAAARDGGQPRGDAPPAQPQAIPESQPEPQSEAQPGPGADGGCDPSSV